MRMAYGKSSADALGACAAHSDRYHRAMIKEAISHFDELSQAEKLLLLEELCDDFAAHPADVPVRNWQKSELERRYREYLANPKEGSAWSEVRGRLLTALQ